MLLKTILILNSVNLCCSILDINFIKISDDYLKLKKKSHGTIFACGSEQEWINLAKLMSKSMYLINFQDLHQPKYHNFSETEFLVEIMLSDTNQMHSIVIIDIECPNAIKVLKMASRKEFYDIQHRWLIIGTEIDQNFLKEIYFRIDSDVMIITKESNSSFFPIFEIYNPGIEYGGELKVLNIGNWFLSGKKSYFNITTDTVTKNHKTNISFVKSFIERRQNMTGLLINGVIVTTEKPFKGNFLHYLTSSEHPEMDSMHRYSYALYQILMDIFKFRVKLVRTNSWGALRNGTWTGCIGVLGRRLAEFSLSPTEIKIERLSQVDQTAIILDSRQFLLFKHPKNSGLGNTFIRPLKSEVWWYMLAVLIFSAIILKIAIREEASQSKTFAEHGSWSSIIMIATIGGITQQGLPHSPSRLASRIICIIVLFFSFMIYQFYSASIVSSLLMEPPKHIKTLHDLTKSKMKILIEDITYNYDFFETTTDPQAIEFYKEKVFPFGKKAFVNPEVGMKYVKEGGYAFQVDMAPAYKMIPENFDERSICDLTEIPLFPPKPTISATRNDSPYIQFITYGLRKIQETGVMQHLQKVWQSPKPKCTLNSQSIPESASFTELGTVFFMLMSSYIIAALLLGFEMLYKKIKDSK